VSTTSEGGALKIGFAVAALLLVGGLVTLKALEYARYLEFSVEAVMDPLPVSRPAPPLNLPAGPGGDALALEALRGHYALVHFWATWCPPCRDELRTLEYLTRHLGERVAVLAITVDEDWEEVKRFFGAAPPTFKLLWDPARVSSSAYGTQKVPETYLVDPGGRVVTKFVGARDWNSAEARRYFKQLLGGTS